MKDKKFLYLMFNLFLIYIVLCIVQDHYLAEKELLLTVSQIKEYCDFNSILNSCVSAIDIKSLINTDYSGTVTVSIYSKLLPIVKYLKYFLLMVNILLLACFVKKRGFSAYKLPIPLIILFSLLSSYKFVYLYTNNIAVIPFIAILAVTVLSCLFFILIFYLINILVKDNRISILFSLYFCGLIYNINFLNLTFIQIANIIFALILLLNLDSVIKFIKIFTIALFCMCTVNAGHKFITQYDFTAFNNNSKNTVKTEIGNYKLTKNPQSNIYILLLDMYAGSKSLEKLYNFDNSPFINSLKDSGFYVNEDIDSNYNRTLFTLSSCLNFKYLENVEYEIPSYAISYSDFFKIAKQLSYKIYYFNSFPIGMTVVDGIIDYSFSTDNKSYLIANLFFGKTVFHYLVKEIFDKDIVSIIFDTGYDIIKNSPKSDKKLVFLHFLMPHEPFLYDENGIKFDGYESEFIEKGDIRTINKYRYIQYLKYTNKKILELIQFIKENDKNNPIIIIFGDHGSRAPVFYKNQKAHLKEMDEIYYLSHFNTILAYYNKDSDFSSYKEINDLLNFFINFSNENFGTAIKKLKKRKFYSDLDDTVIKMSDIEKKEIEY